jgi:hypothetical protein
MEHCWNDDRSKVRLDPLVLCILWWQMCNSGGIMMILCNVKHLEKSLYHCCFPGHKPCIEFPGVVIGEASAKLCGVLQIVLNASELEQAHKGLSCCWTPKNPSSVVRQRHSFHVHNRWLNYSEMSTFYYEIVNPSNNLCIQKLVTTPKDTSTKWCNIPVTIFGIKIKVSVVIQLNLSGIWRSLALGIWWHVVQNIATFWGNVLNWYVF